MSPTSTESPGGSGHKPTYAKRGKITIVACVPCRKRKTKCDGKRPACSQCMARDGQCSYDMTDDQRKLTYLRDNVEQLQEKSSSLETLFHTVQTANDEEAAEVFRRLRSGLDINAVAEQVNYGRLLSGVRKPSSNDTSSDGSEHSAPQDRVRQYDRLMKTIVGSGSNASHDIMRRMQNRDDGSPILNVQSGSLAKPQPLLRQSEQGLGLESIFSSEDRTFGLVMGTEWTATHATTSFGAEFQIGNMREPWTNVTDDQDFVEHLLNVYFTWQHSFFQSFPEALFRADMAAGRTKYCSSLLVNAICASACFLSPRAKAREDRGDGHTIMASFSDESVRLLNQILMPSITTTAALYLMSYVEGTRGRLSRLWELSGRSVLMAFDINLHLRQNGRRCSESESDQELENEDKTRSHAFWGCFHVDQMTCFTLGRMPNLNLHGVTVGLPKVDPEEDALPWTGDEMNLPPRRGARSTTFNRCAALSRIVHSTLTMFFAPVVPLSGSLLLEEFEKYLEWRRTLPPIVATIKDAPPHVLCLHIYYHSAVMLLFRPFLKATITGSDVVPREICRQSANTISDIWAHHRALYGLEGIYMFQVHCLLSACTIHIVNLPTIAATKYFTAACNTFQDLFSRNEWARSSLTILRGLVEKWGLILPQEAEEALCRDQHIARADAYSGFIRAVSPNYCLPLNHKRSDNLSAVYPNYLPSGTQQFQLGQRPNRQQQYQQNQSMRMDVGNSFSQHPPSKRSSVIEPRAANYPCHSIPRDAKRQRVSAPENRFNNIMGSPTTQGPPQSPSSYLYSPLANQPAPLLVPVNSTTSNGVVNGSGPVKSEKKGQNVSRERKDEMHGIQNAVEGLNFGDDWRDPFMGYLGQGQQND